MKSKIFISYARVDADFVLKLCEDLKTSGIGIWIDQFDISVGEIWDQKIQEAILKCDFILVILSPNSVSSQSVLDELYFALEVNKKILPVMYQSCDVPLRIRRIQYCDFTSNYQIAMNKLIYSLEGEKV